MKRFNYFIPICLFFIIIFGSFFNKCYAAKIPVEIIEECNDSILGQRMVYLVREFLRQSSIFKITYINEPRMYIIIHTLNYTVQGNAIAYSYIICQVNKSSLQDKIHLLSRLGTTNEAGVNSVAMDIVAQLEKKVNDSMKSIGSLD